MAKEFVGQEYVAATNGKGLHQQSKGHRILTRVTVTFSVLITTLSAAMIVFCLLFQLCPVSGFSMVTTLNAAGDKTNSALTCMLGDPQHGDIVIFKLYMQNTSLKTYMEKAAQGDKLAAAEIEKAKKDRYVETDSKGSHMYIIKRLIGKPGDHISMCRLDGNYYIYLNGELLDEDYLDPSVSYHSAKNFIQLWNVLNDRSLAELQNDWVSYDYDACTEANQYADQGTGVASRLMLTVPDGAYFVMGDNRGGNMSEYSYSWDSTYFGPLPKSNYVSRCIDILDQDVSMPEYLWKKFVYYVCFGWLWQK